jgi:hypothetical protein
MSSAITIVTSIVPSTTGKAYSLEPDGKLTKHAIASIAHANAVTVEVPTADKMMKVLRKTTEATNQALILDSLRNNGGKPFEVVTEAKLTSLLGRRVGGKGVYEINGRRIAARVKRGMQPSIWVLLDADNPEGMPDEWKANARRAPCAAGKALARDIELRADRTAKLQRASGQRLQFAR